MQATFFKFTKRQNSTKQPAINTGNTVTIQIKDECSFLTPNIIVSKDIVSGVFSPTIYNYVYIPYWERYYYITDWKYLNSNWECSLIVDVLASFKTEIGNTQSYIMRSASQSDGSISDGFYPVKTSPQITSVNVSPAMADVGSFFNGTIVLGVITNDAFRIGAITYYIVTPSELTSFITYAMSDNIYNASSITDVSKGVYKAMFNPLQYVVSCIWYPFVLNSNAPGTIHLGYWDTGVSCKKLEEDEYITHAGVLIPAHPQASARGSYLNHSPYTKITLFYPPFGSIPIDPAFTSKGNYIYIRLTTDLLSGQGNMRISLTSQSNPSDDNILGEKDGQLGVPLQIAQMVTEIVNNGVGNFISGLANYVSNVFSGGDPFNFASIKDGGLSIQRVTSQGSNGALVMLNLSAKLIVEHSILVDENNTEFGKPLCKTKTINTLSGYIKCGEADHQFSGLQSENEDINRYLQNGFYYE